MLRKTIAVLAALLVVGAGVLYLVRGPFASVAPELAARTADEAARAESRRVAVLPEFGLIRTPAPRPEPPTVSGALRILVQDQNGQPIAGAMVLGDVDVDGDRDSAGDATVSGERHSPQHTDADGVVSLSAAPALLRVSHADHAPASVWLTDADLEDGEHTLTLQPGGELRCVVRDEAGQPVAGAEVVLSCGGTEPAARPDGDSLPRVARWQDSLRPAAERDVVYARRARSDDSGAVKFRGLAPGLHELAANHPDYVGHSLLAGQWVRAVSAVDVRPGSNDAQVDVQSLYVQAVVVRNATNLPQRVFESLVLVRGSFDHGITDLLPSMHRAAAATERRIQSLLGSPDGRDFVYVGVGRARMAFDRARPTRVGVRFDRHFAEVVSPRWVRLADFQASDAERLVAAGELATGTLATNAPYPVKAHPIHAGERRPYGFVLHPGAAPAVVPAGRYLLTPTTDDLLIAPERVREIEVAAAAEVLVDFDGVPPIARLRVTVHDAAGQPTNRCEVQFRDAKVFQSARPVDGEVRVIAEPGTYLVWVRDRALNTVYQQEVALLANEERILPISLPR